MLGSFKTKLNHKIRNNPSVVVGNSRPQPAQSNRQNLSSKCLYFAKLTKKGAIKLRVL